MTAEEERIVFSASESYFNVACQELRRCYSGREDRRGDVVRLGPDIGAVSFPSIRIACVADDVRSGRIIFVKHLTGELGLLPLDLVANIDGTAMRVGERVRAHLRPGELAVQAWVSGRNSLSYGPGRLAHQVANVLGDNGFTAVKAGSSRTLSLCITPSGLLLGFAEADHSLSDWPGGRVRLSKSREQISRAELKLEEIFQVLKIPSDCAGLALDLGASPGGWTRILRQHGFEVWSVDPGDLALALGRDPGVHHARTTAGNFFDSTDKRFNIIVNDMKMAPELSAKMMRDAAKLLRPGALAIMTLKIGQHQPVEVVRYSLRILERHYRIRFVRQLHHNRHEVTVVSERR